MKQSEQLCMIMAQAAAEPIGLLLQVSDFGRARQAFYQARAKAGSDGGGAFNELQFRSSPGLEGGNLIIIRQKVEVQASLPVPL